MVSIASSVNCYCVDLRLQRIVPPRTSTRLRSLHPRRAAAIPVRAERFVIDYASIFLELLCSNNIQRLRSDRSTTAQISDEILRSATASSSRPPHRLAHHKK
jgi:hypothetical protein